MKDKPRGKVIQRGEKPENYSRTIVKYRKIKMVSISCKWQSYDRKKVLVTTQRSSQKHDRGGAKGNKIRKVNKRAVADGDSPGRKKAVKPEAGEERGNRRHQLAQLYINMYVLQFQRDERWCIQTVDYKEQTPKNDASTVFRGWAAETGCSLSAHTR